MAEKPVFIDIDTQVDFMLPSGSLYVPGAVQIIPNLKKLFEFARACDIPILSSADAHPPDDPSFKQWPAHCVIGTPGQRRIPETSWDEPRVIANRAAAFAPPHTGRREAPPSEWHGQTIIEKTEYEVSSNPNFDAVLSSLGRRRYVVFGVATEYCVRGAVLALRERKLPVDLVEDAIRAITEEGGRKAIGEMAAAGARLVKTADVCAPQARLKRSVSR